MTSNTSWPVKWNYCSQASNQTEQKTVDSPITKTQKPNAEKEIKQKPPLFRTRKGKPLESGSQKFEDPNTRDWQKFNALVQNLTNTHPLKRKLQ